MLCTQQPRIRISRCVPIRSRITIFFTFISFIFESLNTLARMIFKNSIPYRMILNEWKAERSNKTNRVLKSQRIIKYKENGANEAAQTCTVNNKYCIHNACALCDQN